jgi:hypothetical protein
MLKVLKIIILAWDLAFKFDGINRCNNHQLSMHINQHDAQILVIRIYFPLNALHVSDCINPSSRANFISCTSHFVYSYAGTIRQAVVCV